MISLDPTVPNDVACRLVRQANWGLVPSHVGPVAARGRAGGLAGWLLRI
jgi:hypothetical protein